MAKAVMATSVWMRRFMIRFPSFSDGRERFLGLERAFGCRNLLRPSTDPSGTGNGLLPKKTRRSEKLKPNKKRSPAGRFPPGCGLTEPFTPSPSPPAPRRALPVPVSSSINWPARRPAFRQRMFPCLSDAALYASPLRFSPRIRSFPQSLHPGRSHPAWRRTRS